MQSLLGRPRPHINQGIALTPGESAHPEMWSGLLGLWVPSIGIQQPSALVLLDRSGGRSNFTMENMEVGDWVIGRNGYAVDMDGSNERLILASTAALRPNQLTIMFWVRYDAASDYDLFAGIVDGGNGGWKVWKSPAGGDGAPGNHIVFSINGYNANFASKAFTGDGLWHHIACTYDKTTIRIYVDGIQGSSMAYTSDISYADTNLYMGGRSGWNFLDGAYDDIRYYSRALTQQEVTAAAQGASPLTPARFVLGKAAAVGGGGDVVKDMMGGFIPFPRS